VHVKTFAILPTGRVPVHFVQSANRLPPEAERDVFGKTEDGGEPLILFRPVAVSTGNF
jgi:hypothetical protein